MRTKKRKRLETAGWKVGSAKDFLDLTTEEGAVVELKLTLSEIWNAPRHDTSKIVTIVWKRER